MCLKCKYWKLAIIATTLFCNLTELNCFVATFSRASLIYTFLSIYFLCKILVRADKYLLQLGSREPQEKFSYANKVWFTVMSIIRKPLKLLKIYVVLTMICLWSWYSSKFNLCYQYKKLHLSQRFKNFAST